MFWSRVRWLILSCHRCHGLSNCGGVVVHAVVFFLVVVCWTATPVEWRVEEEKPRGRVVERSAVDCCFAIVVSVGRECTMTSCEEETVENAVENVVETCWSLLSWRLQIVVLVDCGTAVVFGGEQWSRESNRKERKV